ncbi:putative proteasome-type protease [Andreprevotia lacus DSM 23236]|jgi:putative proteasome-type protease|uniref:Putative proteasome-type protease n=1 Tax=Andreprevotia lacus DSM 23236 TaxID=1121001 RepID=A0A1W1WWG1_9NEIS|nr:proteasome-type protease [Andreprevotia lacus]SMC15943.1 putative proteasome-type protease [Andreprevotia lacus DSM 23236]
MTYCVAMALQDGLLFASDSRTNAGVDHIATFRKMHVFETAGERLVVLLSAGNLATTQSVISLLRSRCGGDGASLLTVPTMYAAAELVGQAVREVIARDSGGEMTQGVDFSCSILLGGQIHGEAPRLFNVYAAGNFIEATEDTPYFQIGEAKYGKPIIDRVVRHDTALKEALKCTLISFDSTIRSNLSVGLPVDVLSYRRDSYAPAKPYRVTEHDPYFNSIRQRWGAGLRQVFSELDDAGWFEQ